MKAGDPHGSVLGPLLFLNDIAYDIQSLLRLFSDDSPLIFSYINPLEVEDRLNLDLQVLDNRAKQWLVDFRERPFNLKGWGYVFFLKKYSDSKCCWKKYSDFGGGKKKIWFRVFVI